MEECAERLVQAKINNTHCSPLNHLACYLIVEGYQVCQDWFPIFKSTVTTFNHLSVLNIFGEGDKDYLLCHLPRYRGKANWPIVPSILLLADFEDRCDICLVPAFGNLPEPSWPFKVTGLPQCSWMHSHHVPWVHVCPVCSTSLSPTPCPSHPCSRLFYWSQWSGLAQGWFTGKGWSKEGI